ncbi:UvrD-helicase domain-containing protein [Thermodesulfovibrio hydrogeniphilus]
MAMPPQAEYTIIKASAGAGKTTELTKRFIELLISMSNDANALKKILAITFSNNAALEMKTKILERLKKLYFNDEETVASVKQTYPDIEPQKTAEILIDKLINNYSDFQVKTIDSFMTSIFKASAIDFGYNPDFDILMENKFYLDYAFDFYLKDVGEGTEKAKNIEKIIEIISRENTGKRYIWQPHSDIFKNIKTIYDKSSLLNKKFCDVSEFITKQDVCRDKLIEKIKQFLDFIQKHQLIVAQKRHSFIESLKKAVETNNPLEVYEKSIKQIPLAYSQDDKNRKPLYDEASEIWEDIKDLCSEYFFYYAFTYFLPYNNIFNDFLHVLEKIKQSESKIFIEDVNKKLCDYIPSFVPDIYFRLGETIKHYFIDEFQDTSPIQWSNLSPLIENALSEGGSLLVVGDTKQAIYTFRGADYRIMKEMEKNEVFPSAQKKSENLETNYRSRRKILDFVEYFFNEKLKSDETYINAMSLTGLDEFKQKSNKEGGYVELRNIYFEEQEDTDDIKAYIQTTIDDILSRGYSFKDIAVLAWRNEEVVNLSAILNELGYPFISYSSLDVRKRKVFDEIIHLFRFLDSPIDDFSFSTFLLSDIFRKRASGFINTDECNLSQQIQSFLLRQRGQSPIYKAFKEEFGDLWDKLFDGLFRKAGYLPVYDLLCDIYDTFAVFKNFPDEESAFVKLLDVVQKFESKGFGSFKEFLDFVNTEGDDSNIWNINVGSDIDAIQVMTVHKAKGLGFPVVIFYLDWHKHHSESLYLHENEQQVYLVRISDNIAKNCDSIAKIKEAKKIDDLADDMNKLYVAFTRAKDELYILCRLKSNEKSNSQGKHFPFNVFHEISNLTLGEKTFYKKEFKPQRITLDFEPSIRITDEKPSYESVHIEEKLRGELIHRILSEIQYYNESTIDLIRERLNFLNQSILIDSEKLKQIGELLAKLFENEELFSFFLPKDNRKVFNEFEMADREGKIHRIDRLVIDEDTVTVIEYKTGKETPEHEKQIKEYMELVSSVYKTKTVRGMIYYIDSGEIKWLNLR